MHGPKSKPQTDSNTHISHTGSNISIEGPTDPSVVDGESFVEIPPADPVSDMLDEYERWIAKSCFNYTTDTMVTGPDDPLLKLILAEFPETLVVPTVRTRAYVR